MDKTIKEDTDEILQSGLIDWDIFRGTTVLITGANGMIPAYFVYTFVSLNRRFSYSRDKVHILALVRNAEKARHKFGTLLDDSCVDLIVQDVSDPICYDGKVDFVIHAASQASLKYYGVDPVGTINANVLGTINTLNLAKDKNSRAYLYISTGDVYGIVNPDNFPFEENDYGYIDLLNVRSCYGESKRMGEQLCVAYNYQYHVPTRIVRVFILILQGCSPMMVVSLQILPMILQMAAI